MNTVTLLAANGNVISNIRLQRSQCLHEQGSGRLPVHVKVTPDADRLVLADSLSNAFNGGFDVWEPRGWSCIRVQKCPGGVNSLDPASDESLRDEGRQVQVRE